MAWIDDSTLKTMEARIKRLEQMQAGRGITLAKSPGGITISSSDTGKSKTIKSDNLSGDPKVLTHTQGTQDTDTYDRDDDKVPVTFTVITDIKYDMTTHKLTYRERTITTDKLQSISAESDLIEITEAQACPAS